jgi:hypothetical protein
MQLTDWPLVEVAMLLTGLAQILLSKTGFDPLGRDQSSFRLSAQLIGQPTSVMQSKCTECTNMKSFFYKETPRQKNGHTFRMKIDKQAFSKLI